MDEQPWLERIAALTVDGTAPPPDLSWLEESYRAPSPFWTGLHQMVSHAGAWPLKSAPLQKYDFFHDLMLSHHNSPSAALRSYDPVQGWRELSYDHLSERAGERAAAWTSKGVKPGAKICILLPMGVEFAVSLLAILKLGGIVSCLPSSGRRLLAHRLKSLSPDHLVGDPLAVAAFPDWKDRFLGSERPLSSGAKALDRSFSYPSGATVGLLFDPCSPKPSQPIPLAADEAYLGALREGRLALGLRPGDKVAFPGASLLETQPAILLSVWAHGATFVHIEWEDLSKNPRLLGDEALQTVGVTTAARDLFMQGLPPLAPQWNAWFRNPAESSDLEPWQQFIRALRLESIPAINLRWRPPRGGATLFSLRRMGVAHANVAPSAGVPWKLKGLGSEEADQFAECGALTILPLAEGGEDGESFPSSEIIARNRGEWLYLGMTFPDRGGRSYQAGEVLAVLSFLQWPCSIVAAPSQGPGRAFQFIVMVFVGPSEQLDKGHIASEIHRRIEREMGRDSLPDRVVFFPLLPRRNEEGGIDHDWCRSQYLSGSLFRKSRSPLQRCLAKLRTLLPS